MTRSAALLLLASCGGAVESIPAPPDEAPVSHAEAGASSVAPAACPANTINLSAADCAPGTMVCCTVCCGAGFVCKDVADGGVCAVP